MYCYIFAHFLGEPHSCKALGFRKKKKTAEYNSENKNHSEINAFQNQNFRKVTVRNIDHDILHSIILYDTTFQNHYWMNIIWLFYYALK